MVRMCVCGRVSTENRFSASATYVECWVPIACLRRSLSLYLSLYNFFSFVECVHLLNTMNGAFLMTFINWIKFFIVCCAAALSTPAQLVQQRNNTLLNDCEGSNMRFSFESYKTVRICVRAFFRWTYTWPLQPPLPPANGKCIYILWFVSGTNCVQSEMWYAYANDHAFRDRDMFPQVRRVCAHFACHGLISFQTVSGVLRVMSMSILYIRCNM